MNVLLTGGAGYIGTHTCIELINAGHTVVVADNFSNSSPKAIERVEEITGKKFRFTTLMFAMLKLWTNFLPKIKLMQ